MRNLWLLTRKEYLERVRSKAFLIFTILTPALMFCFTVLPAELAGMRGSPMHIAVAAPDQVLGEAIRERMMSDLPQVAAKPKIDITIDLSAEEHKELMARVNNGALTGFLWITPEAIANRNVPYATNTATDFIQQGVMKNALQQAMTYALLTRRGLSKQEVEDLAKPVELDITDLSAPRAAKRNERSALVSGMFMLLLMYMTVLIYGVNVMRSVLEEKTSRVLEVLLASATPREIMASKILGVGAVGLTQIAIWGVIGIALAPFAASAFSLIHLSGKDWAAFAVFFLLGYVLYSSLYAAVGAALNSEQEAQQVNVVIAMPLILSIMIGVFVIRQPDQMISVIFSFVPFCTPVIMLLRIVLQQPPWWQIALSIGLMLASIYGTLALSAKIYRVGILMYGKRPTLPEIIKWLKYD